MIYLEDYLDTVESLPQELTRNFTQMRELDVSAQTSIGEIGEQTQVIPIPHSQTFLANIHKMSQADRQAALISLSGIFKSSLKHGAEKVALATQTYGMDLEINKRIDMVDQHVMRLDDDLEKYERELAAAVADAEGHGHAKRKSNNKGNHLN
jgi:predicted AlkP superfamily pyrophosphatase or phosphodiesterase